MSRESRIINKLKVAPINKFVDNFILPNNSGDHRRSIKRDTPINDTDLVNKKYVEIAHELIALENSNVDMFDRVNIELFSCDANTVPELNLPPIDYCITSPPYWDMLRMKGAKTQKNREESGVDVFYSDDPRDLGNISDYNLFIESLVRIYRLVYDLLRDKAYMTIIVKNIKKRGRI